MARQINLGGSFTLGNTSLTVNRMGYGAMQLAGPHVWGPPRDLDGAITVLREAVEAGVNHIDTSDFYGLHMTNQIIKIEHLRENLRAAALKLPSSVITALNAIDERVAPAQSMS